jgi:hypothetical protein
VSQPATPRSRNQEPNVGGKKEALPHSASESTVCDCICLSLSLVHRLHPTTSASHRPLPHTAICLSLRHSSRSSWQGFIDLGISLLAAGLFLYNPHLKLKSSSARSTRLTISLHIAHLGPHLHTHPHTNISTHHQHIYHTASSPWVNHSPNQPFPSPTTSSSPAPQAISAPL